MLCHRRRDDWPDLRRNRGSRGLTFSRRTRTSQSASHACVLALPSTGAALCDDHQYDPRSRGPNERVLRTPSRDLPQRGTAAGGSFFKGLPSTLRHTRLSGRPPPELFEVVDVAKRNVCRRRRVDRRRTAQGRQD